MIIGCTSTGGADALDCGAHLRSSSRGRARRRRSRSCALRPRPSSRRPGSRARRAASTASSAVAATRSGDDRHAVGRRAARASACGVEPALVRLGEARARRPRAPRGGRCRRASGIVPGGPAQPFGALAARARGRARPTPGTRTPRPASLVAQRRRRALGADHDREHRLVARGSARPRLRIAAATSSAPATTGGTKSTISASTPGRASSVRQHAPAYVAPSPSRAGRPGCARLASPGSSWPRARRASRRSSSGSSSPAASQASAQRIPRPPAFVITPTRRPRGSGWLESSAAASTSSSSVRARRTPAWRKSASTAVSEPASAAVCELAARAPAPVVPP